MRVSIDYNDKINILIENHKIDPTEFTVAT